MSKRRDDDPEAAGEKYADKQINGDHFMDWVHDQLLEASRMDPADVLPLETKRDAKHIARNMLQQLEWDAKRDDPTRDLGIDDPRAFFKGLRNRLRDPGVIDWLADELLEIKSSMGKSEVSEDPVQGCPPGSNDNAFSNRKTLGAALRRVGIMDSGAQVRNLRVEGEKTIVFPSMPGMTTYWHSITLTPDDDGGNVVGERHVRAAGASTSGGARRKTAELTLGRDGMGPEADEADFDAWVAYVSARIDERTGLDVTVEERMPRDVQDNSIRADSDNDRQTIRDALHVLWEEFAADTSAWPVREAPHGAVASGGAADFEALLRQHTDIGDRQLLVRHEHHHLGGPSHYYESVYVNFVNLPHGSAPPLPRASFWINGFNGSDPHAPPPSGKVKIDMSNSTLPREYRLRSKTGTPDAIARYLGEFLTRVARGVPPKFMHMTRENTVESIHGYDIEAVFYDERQARRHERSATEVLQLPIIDQRAIKDGYVLVYGPINRDDYLKLEERLYRKFGNAVCVRMVQRMYAGR